jgi:hypothetical protein
VGPLIVLVKARSASMRLGSRLDCLRPLGSVAAAASAAEADGLTEGEYDDRLERIPTLRHPILEGDAL